MIWGIYGSLLLGLNDMQITLSLALLNNYALYLQNGWEDLYLEANWRRFGFESPAHKRKEG